MNVTRSQREHPLNRKATELLRQIKVIPSVEMLPMMQLMIEALDNEIQDFAKARLYQLDSKVVMKQVTPALKLTDLDDTTPYQAALLIVEALGIEDALYAEVHEEMSPA